MPLRTDSNTIVKKRRRPIDPCLGYYMTLASRPSPSSKERNKPPARLDIEVSSDPAPFLTSPSEEDASIFSVDAFLRQQVSDSPKRATARNQLSKRRKRVITSSEADLGMSVVDECVKDGAYSDPCSGSPWSSPLPPRRQKRGKPKSKEDRSSVGRGKVVKIKMRPTAPFSGRMHRAATLSHVDQATLTQSVSRTIPLSLRPFSVGSQGMQDCKSRTTPFTLGLARELRSEFDTPAVNETVKKHRPLSQLTQWNSGPPVLLPLFHSLDSAPFPNHPRRQLSRTPLAPLALTTFEQHSSSVAIKYRREDTSVKVPELLQLLTSRRAARLAPQASLPEQSRGLVQPYTRKRLPLEGARTPAIIIPAAATGQTLPGKNQPSARGLDLGDEAALLRSLVDPDTNSGRSSPTRYSFAGSGDAMADLALSVSSPGISQRPLRSLTSMLDELRETARDVVRTQTQRKAHTNDTQTQTPELSRCKKTEFRKGKRNSREVRSSPVKRSLTFKNTLEVGRQLTKDEPFLKRRHRFNRVTSLPSVLSFLNENEEQDSDHIEPTPMLDAQVKRNRLQSEIRIPVPAHSRQPSFRPLLINSIAPASIISTSPRLPAPHHDGCRNVLGPRFDHFSTEDEKAAELLDRLRNGEMSAFGNAMVELGSSPFSPL